jgi:hypothetical protein
VTLTATANQEMAPTPYGIGIIDTVSGAEIAHAGAGTTLTTTVAQSTATTRRYVGVIDNTGAVNVQAQSGPVVVTWGATAPPPSAPSVAGVSPPSGPSDGGTSVTISGANLSGATAVRFGGVAATSFSVVSSTSISAVAPPGSTTVDVTVTTPGGTSAASVRDEFTYTFASNGFAVSLSASATSAAAGGSVTLTATANQDMGPTAYGIGIIDTVTGVEIAHIGSGTTLTTTVTQSTASTHRYVALICNTGGTNAQASSAPAIITWS